MTDDGTGTPWRPERLTAVLGERPVQDLRYVVLEEVVDHVAVLQAWPWPLVDEKGRLFWRSDSPGEGLVEIATLAERLREQVYRRSMSRQPRCGDTLAGVVSPEHVPAAGLVDDLRRVFPDGLYDVSAEAHSAAQLAYQGSLAAIGSPQSRSGRERLLLRGRAPRVTLAPPHGETEPRPRR